MEHDRFISLPRRDLLRLLAGGGIAAITGLPAVQALAQSRRDVARVQTVLRQMQEAGR